MLFLQVCVAFHYIFAAINCSEILYDKLKPIMKMQVDLKDFRTRIKLQRSIDFTFPKTINFKCVTIGTDNSYFSEMFFSEVSSVMPPVVNLDRWNQFKCDAVLVAAEKVEGLRRVLRHLPRYSTQRIWSIIDSAPIDEVQAIFQENLTDFGDANVIIVILREYDHVLRIQQPNRTLEKIRFPKKGKTWPAIEDYIKTFSGKEVKYSTGTCDIHSELPNEKRKFWGLDGKIFEDIVNGMNLKPKYVPVHDPLSTKIAGTFVKNGSTWEGGVLGNLAKGTADVGFCGFLFERKKFWGGIQMGSPFRRTCLIYAVPHPTPNVEDWTVVFYSFTPTVHLVLATSIIVFATAIRFVANFRLIDDPEHSGFKSWGYCLNVAWGMLFQGYYPSSSYKMGKIRPFTCLWALFSILIASSFSSHLVSNFTRPPYNLKPRDIKDLVLLGYEQPKITFFPLPFILNPEEYYTHEWLSRIYALENTAQLADALESKPRQALLGLMYDNHVFVPATPEMLPEHILDRYETMDSCIAVIYEGFAFRRGSPFVIAFNEYMLAMRDSGIMSKYVRDILMEISTKYPTLRGMTKSKQSMSVLNTLSIFHLKGVFVALLLGLAISTLALIGELIFYFEFDRNNGAQPFS